MDVTMSETNCVGLMITRERMRPRAHPWSIRESRSLSRAQPCQGPLQASLQMSDYSHRQTTLHPKIRSVASVIKNWCYTITLILMQGNAFSASDIRLVANFRLKSPTKCIPTSLVHTCESLRKNRRT